MSTDSATRRIGGRAGAASRSTSPVRSPPGGPAAAVSFAMSLPVLRVGGGVERRRTG
ncbi:hypothetical protein GCM10023200_52500 [Actinomycetospora chlora]|uniref:Uncharacterized protein n=1 Tax=Actinomycetospora chlora TaxID=663608 RepID=A0ABP9CHW7_9PSEU